MGCIVDIFAMLFLLYLLGFALEAFGWLVLIILVLMLILSILGGVYMFKWIGYVIMLGLATALLGPIGLIAAILVIVLSNKD